jgi:CheY-like chemotaxis protein
MLHRPPIRGPVFGVHYTTSSSHPWSSFRGPLYCSPRAVVAEVISLMRVPAQAKRIPLTVEYDGPIPERIHSDPTRLRQILINLIGNAIKFTEVGEVRLVVRLLNDSLQHPRLQFQVIDTGIGMTEEEAGSLFQPFSQGHALANKQYGGTGLGLAISKRLASLLGGNISVNSTPMKGSTFSVTIETGSLDEVNFVECPSEAKVDLKSKEALGSTAKLACRILLAEDGPDNQRLISFFLKKSGAKVVVVENGQGAFESAIAAQNGGEAFDVILMDMQMPVMDGYEATRRLRANGYTGPIVALTAHAMVEDRQLCLQAGCDDYLAKPIDRSQLIGTVSKHCPEAQKAGCADTTIADSRGTTEGQDAVGTQSTPTLHATSADDPGRKGTCSTSVASPHPAEATLPEESIGLNGRILVVEDGPANERLISFLLRKAGADVVVAQNGEIGKRLALAAKEEGQPFDVILMDMRMPIMDGYTATSELRREGYAGPIIAVTANAMAEDRQKCLDAGCDDYLSKPINRASLVAAVARNVQSMIVGRDPTEEVRNRTTAI